MTTRKVRVTLTLILIPFRKIYFVTKKEIYLKRQQEKGRSLGGCTNQGRNKSPHCHLDTIVSNHEMLNGCWDKSLCAKQVFNHLPHL